VFDLGKLYQPQFSWQQAQTVAGTLGKQMVQLGLVEFSTQTMTSVLKANAFTYLAGGTVQGLSAAYLTRIAGLSLIEYFQEQELSQESGETLNLNRLQTKLQEVFQNNQRTVLFKSILQKGKEKLFQQTNVSQPYMNS
jgi:Neuraminidase (sialidase)